MLILFELRGMLPKDADQLVQEVGKCVQSILYGQPRVDKKNPREHAGADEEPHIRVVTLPKMWEEHGDDIKKRLAPLKMDIKYVSLDEHMNRKMTE